MSNISEGGAKHKQRQGFGERQSGEDSPELFFMR